MDVFPLKDGSYREVSLVSAMCFLQQIEALAVSSDVVTVGFFFSFHKILSDSLVLHPQRCRRVCVLALQGVCMRAGGCCVWQCAGQSHFCRKYRNFVVTDRSCCKPSALFMCFLSVPGLNKQNCCLKNKFQKASTTWNPKLISSQNRGFFFFF